MFSVECSPAFDAPACPGQSPEWLAPVRKHPLACSSRRQEALTSIPRPAARPRAVARHWCMSHLYPDTFSVSCPHSRTVSWTKAVQPEYLRQYVASANRGKSGGQPRALIAVAQIGNLLYRRLPAGSAGQRRTLPFSKTALLADISHLRYLPTPEYLFRAERREISI